MFCIVCEKHYRGLRNLVNHQKSEHPNKLLCRWLKYDWCEDPQNSMLAQCEKEYPDLKSLLKHHEIHKAISKEKPKTKKQERQSEKRMIDIELRRFECEFCHHCFSEKSKLMVHMDKRVCQQKCEFCHRCFSSESNFRVHMDSRACQEKLETKKTKEQERQSAQRMLNVELRRFECELCHHCFTRKSNLMAHVDSRACERRRESHDLLRL